MVVGQEIQLFLIRRPKFFLANFAIKLRLLVEVEVGSEYRLFQLPAVENELIIQLPPHFLRVYLV